MPDAPLVVLRVPPVVRQGERHICWAAAYESWARASGFSRSVLAASSMVERLSEIGRVSAASSGQLVDNAERLLPSGVSMFAQYAGMAVRLWSPRRLSAEELAQQLRRGHVWLWTTPRHGVAAHVVVVYGVVYDEKKQGVVLSMDPARGIVRELWSDVLARVRIFAVGTPLSLRPTVDPFAGMLSETPQRPPEMDPFRVFL